MKTLPHTHGCFVCGESNSSGLNLRFETDGRFVYSRYLPRPEHVGFKDTVHGGIIASLLDEIMVWACAVSTRSFAYCAELNVRYIKPASPDEPAFASGTLIGNRRGKLFEAQAELKNSDGTLLATATGKYMPIRAADIAGLLTDVVGNVRDVIG